MIRSYRFLLRPTVQQAGALTEMLRDHCSLYNGALQERRDAYRHVSKTGIKYGEQSAQLKDIRAFDPERHGRWSFSSQQATLRRLDKAFQAFFRRVKAGETPGYPRFRGVNWFDTVEFPKDGDGCRWDSTPQDPVTRVRLQGVGHVRVHRHRPVRGRVKTVSVKREGRRWYVILACDEVPAEPLPATGAVTGIDMGVAHFLTTSEGEHIANPRHGRKNTEALADAQRALRAFPRRKRENRTARHRRAVEKVANLHRKVRRQRTDHAHKTALALVRDYDTIAHEQLRIANMVRTPKAKPDPDAPGTFLPNGAAAKAGLNKSIHDAGWGVFLGILAHKAESAGRVLIPVDPRNTSRTCPACGHVSGENRTTQARFECVSCTHTANADVVGALNVAVRAGLVLPDVA
ncbi:RNA-guided endonuclease InsQ/TnpB family protein [Streptomyces sp. NBC_00576]|uniref:RNA-guided endonuclease InsQ/TnpB family protein n=1 Tax=Streptomyces sp. NBC_00576 TaxID=2903665 RepID=UPI002E819B2F|nr:transposase [Streptomyces sp. NBC_00576]WUB72649.1 transposase [Streptomyces sp. NBC_00576]